MANIKQLKHLEHLEDEMLNYGVEGCKAAVAFLKELRKMIGQSNSSGFIQTKWDGAPSVVCGKHPYTKRFFVGTKSVFNKDNPKICFFDHDIDAWYGTQPVLRDKLKTCLTEFKKLDIDGIVQGDLLFTNDKKNEIINGETLITFKPNTITYAIPANQPLGKAAAQANIGVVFHTHYVGDDISNLQATAGGKTSSSIPDVLTINNDTPMDKVNFSNSELNSFDNHVRTIEQKCRQSGDFLDELVKFSGSTGDAKWHVSSYIKQFFNSEIKAARTIGDVGTTLENLTNFYHNKTKAAADKLTVKTQIKKKALIYESENYLMENQAKFKAMIELYKELQSLKQMVIDKLDKLENQIKTFVLTDKGYKITTHEGYVMHKDGDMIKFVNRIEFSYNNFTLAKQWR